MDGLVVPLAEKLLVACLDALEPWLVQQLRDWGFDFVDVPYIEAKNLGVNLVALGDNKVLSMIGASVCARYVNVHPRWWRGALLSASTLSRKSITAHHVRQQRRHLT